MIKREKFGNSDGKQIDLLTIRNPNGLQANVTNYGATLVSLNTPDKLGNLDNVVLGYETLDDYKKNAPYLGCSVGRFANRIAKGTFTLEGKTYQLACNNHGNHLHGGDKGFDKVVWDYHELSDSCIRFNYFSPDGEEGYPGNLKVSVQYCLTEDNALELSYEATADKKTIINLTHHSYFNLKGHGNILEHELSINADAYTPVHPDSIPTGEIRNVKNSPFDFRTKTKVSQNIHANDEQLKFSQGYDHNFVLNSKTNSLSKAAELYEETTGRTMEVWTTEPGIQFYTGNFLDGTITGHNGRIFQKYCALCLETQHFPDSPNQSHFPSTELEAGETFRSTTAYKFKTAT